MNIEDEFLDYKQQKINWVTGLGGSSQLEILYYISIIPISYYLWKQQTISECLKSTYQPTFSIIHKPWKVAQRYSQEILIFLLPLLFNLYIFEHSWVMTFTWLSWIFWKLYYMPLLKRPEDRWKKSELNKWYDANLAQKKSMTSLGYLTSYRAMLMILTCVCILSVDFTVFPRKFAKVETFGTSLMDLGVGCFIFSTGVISFQRSSKLAQLSLVPRVAKALQTVFPLLLLGLLRTVVIKSIDYHEHVSEYGVHWNFFYTLSLLPLVIALLSRWNLRYWGWAVGLLYQVFLSFGLQDWILTADRTFLLSQNKEGICSFFGYLAIFLIGMDVGEVLLSPPKTFDDYEESPILLVSLTFVYWVVYGISYLAFGIDVSRRMANFSFVAWVAAINTLYLSAMYWIEFSWDAYFLELKGADSKPLIPKAPLILESVNKNPLTVFLVANLLTGLVNLTLDTLNASPFQAILILSVYTLSFSSLAVFLYLKKIRIR